MRTINERLEDLDAYLIIGVGGDSGAGKTTFSRGIRYLLRDELVSGFSLDDYHLEDRATRKRSGNLPLDPKNNNLHLLAEHLSELRNGNEIIKPVYNHRTGELDPHVLFRPTRVMIVEGLHPFYTEELRQQMDFTIFVDPVREVKWKWKMKRDVEKRGHDEKDAFQEILARELLFKLYIDIQKVFSEVIVHIEPSRYSDANLENPRIRLLMKAADISANQIDMNFDLTEFITRSEGYFSLEFGNDYYYGKKFNIMTVDGLIPKSSFDELKDRICNFTGTTCGRIFDSKEETVNPSGVAQLMIVWRFLEKLHIILNDLENAMKNTD
jgi:phosphoribulokinase